MSRGSVARVVPTLTGASDRTHRGSREHPLIRAAPLQREASAEPLFSEYLRDSQPNPEERLQELEQREMLEDALQKLPVEMRRAIELCKSRGYSLKEAASALGLPVSTLKARVHRGRRALMVHLKRETQVRRKPAANRGSLLCPASEERLCARESPANE